MAALTCRVDREGPVIRVAVDGQLSMASAPSLRATLLKCLADNPVAVVVDLAGVAIEARMALSAVRAVRDRAADRPSVPLLLCGVDEATVRPHQRRVWLSDIPVFGSVDAAMTAAKRPDLLERRVRACLPPIAEAPQRARELAGLACRAWGVEHLTAPAQLIASELVSNAICHTGGTARLAIIRGDRYLHIVVRDRQQRLPVPVDDESWDVASEHGRGLHLVRTVAASWGAHAMPGGKAVWATLRMRALR